MIANDNQFRPDSKVFRKFIRWIEEFDTRHARAWERSYKADPESATCEVMYWGVLSDCGVSIQPNPALGRGKPTPDFVCHKNGEKFYVEVTCIRIDTATRHTFLNHEPTPGSTMYDSLNDAIMNEVVSKTSQCANLDSPCLLAVGTFHCHASISCIRKVFVEDLLTGETGVGQHFDPRIGRIVGESFLATHLKAATFLKPDVIHGIEPARKPVSALLVAGFGCAPPPILGIIHPFAAREFDPNLIERIPFCRLKCDFALATLTTEWTSDPEQDRRDHP